MVGDLLQPSPNSLLVLVLLYHVQTQAPNAVAGGGVEQRGPGRWQGGGQLPDWGSQGLDDTEGGGDVFQNRANLLEYLTSLQEGAACQEFREAGGPAVALKIQVPARPQRHRQDDWSG